MAATALLPALWLGAGCARSVAQSPAPTPGHRIRTVAATAEPDVEPVTVVGALAPWTTATVAADVAERIVALPVEVGDRVAAGAVLARLRDDVARAALREAEAGVAEAVAGRRRLDAEYARAVVESGAALDAARAQLAQGEAARAEALARSRQAGEGERKARAATRAQELAQAEAALRRADADADLARLEHERMGRLVAEGAAPRQLLDRATAARDVAAAARDAAAQALSLAREGARAEDVAAASAASAQARAGIDAAQGRVREARAALTAAGTRDLRLTTLRRQIDGLRAQEDRARALAAQARIQADRHVLRAPFAGRILAKRAERGESVSPGVPVVQIGAIDPMRARFPVPEAVRSGIRPGAVVRVRVDALPGRTFAGMVANAGFEADPRTRAFPVEIRLANPDETLLPGMVVRWSLRAGSGRGRVTVPIDAVASDGDGTYVLVPVAGRARRRPVSLGAVRGDRVVVRAGLAAGERIVDTPQSLADGAPVADGEASR